MKEGLAMDEWRVRRCGNDWRYCNGDCGPCMRKYGTTNRTYQKIVESHEALKKDVPENTMHFYVDVTTMSDSKSVEMFKGTGVVVHKRDGSQWVNGKRVEDGDGDCDPCLRTYKPATNKTDAPKDWPSYLDLPKRRDGGDGNG